MRINLLFIGVFVDEVLVEKVHLFEDLSMHIYGLIGLDCNLPRPEDLLRYLINLHVEERQLVQVLLVLVLQLLHLLIFTLINGTYRVLFKI